MIGCRTSTGMGRSVGRPCEAVLWACCRMCGWRFARGRRRGCHATGGLPTSFLACFWLCCMSFNVLDSIGHWRWDSQVSLLRVEHTHISFVSREGSCENVLVQWSSCMVQWFMQDSLMELLNACGSNGAVQATLGIAADLSFLPSAVAVRAKCVAAPS